ncbi:MAG: glycosyltransferase family 39 protein [Candidatus Moranbacteria bacterium]|nr:glycosyltransferase family 39 protein [Candidatus Moranbacteria bacterium]MDD3964962.1 glycosyltransferase family 39 protein [Candidatus Moranbacteria bacterium]
MTSKEIIEFGKKRKFHIALIIIFGIGFFLRTYHFGDWLHFETDQVDDFLITSPAVQSGIGNLKLLGPRAGAEELRIGPAYYYIEYLGGRIFANTPSGHAMPNLILALASLPLFFVFARIYFSHLISLSLLALYSTSFYMIQYARFSWNPNVLPFFILAMFYLLLRSISVEEKNRNIFFILSLVLLSIISQLHFNGLFIIVPTYILFLLIKRPHFPLRTVIYAILFSVLIYSPLIVHEIKYDWSNSKLFIEKISGSSKEKKNISEKIVQNFRYNSGEFFLILTGEDRINTSRPNGYSLGLFCKTCKEDFFWRLSALLFYMISILLIVWNFFIKKRSIQKDFLIISGLWLFIGSLYFISLTLKKLYIYPRFYLVLAPLAFIFLGLIFEQINFKKKILNGALVIIATLLIVGINLTKISDSFLQLNNSEEIMIEVETEDVFPNYYRTPFFIHQKITDYIEQKVPNKDAKIFISSESEYEPTYWIFLQGKGYDYLNKFDKKQLSRDGEYFSIQMSTDKKKNDLSQFIDLFDVMEIKSFGIMNVIYLKPKINILYSIDSKIEAQKTRQAETIRNMHSWKDLLDE